MSSDGFPTRVRQFYETFALYGKLILDFIDSEIGYGRIKRNGKIDYFFRNMFPKKKGRRGNFLLPHEIIKHWNEEVDGIQNGRRTTIRRTLNEPETRAQIINIINHVIKDVEPRPPVSIK